jgi:hypothetical protein
MGRDECTKGRYDSGPRLYPKTGCARSYGVKNRLKMLIY